MKNKTLEETGNTETEEQAWASGEHQRKQKAKDQQTTVKITVKKMWSITIDTKLLRLAAMREDASIRVQQNVDPILRRLNLNFSEKLSGH